MITAKHKDTETYIGHTMAIIDKHYSGDMKGKKVDSIYNEQINNVFMSWNFSLRPCLRTRSAL